MESLSLYVICIGTELMEQFENSPDLEPQPKPRSKWTLSPGRLIISSFLVVIGTGTFLLSLPSAHPNNLSLIDAFFTATSCICGTGLSTISMSSFTNFGHYVILILIQIGGIGLMTMSFFMAAIFLGKMGNAARSITSEAFRFDSIGKMKRFLFNIIGITFVIEFIGAMILFRQLKTIYPHSKALFHSIFLSVSSFCNAGITITDDSLIGLHSHVGILSVLGTLTFAGGLGFVVWYELVEKSLNYIRQNKHKSRKLSLHSKLVLLTSITLIALCFISILLIEHNGAFANMSFFEKIGNSMFYALSLRSGGFETVATTALAPATLLIFMMLMLIGSSPGSTGGGMKTTTVTLFLATLVSTIKHRKEVEICGRSISENQLYNAIAIVSISTFWLTLSTFILLLSDSNFSSLEYLLETIPTTFLICSVKLTTSSTVSSSVSNPGMTSTSFMT